MRRLAAALITLAAAGCATSGAVPQPFPAPGGPPPRPEAHRRAPESEGVTLVRTALALQGVPYRNGGADPGGFDCSGLVQYVFAQHGVDVPRTVVEQYRIGSHVEHDTVRAGDLLFFNTSGASPSHVGISIGGDEFVHAPNFAGTVRVERLGATYWRGRFVGARRLP